jgi:hypothetical protein
MLTESHGEREGGGGDRDRDGTKPATLVHEPTSSGREWTILELCDVAPIEHMRNARVVGTIQRRRRFAAAGVGIVAAALQPIELGMFVPLD